MASVPIFAPKVTVSRRLADPEDDLKIRVEDVDGKPADHTEPEAWAKSLRDRLESVGLAPENDTDPLTPEQVDALRRTLPEELADYAMVRRDYNQCCVSLNPVAAEQMNLLPDHDSSGYSGCGQVSWGP